MSEQSSITRAEVARLLELAEKATPGPWRWRGSKLLQEIPVGKSGAIYADTPVLDDGSASGEYDPIIDTDGDTAKFIAESRTALPTALRQLQTVYELLRNIYRESSPWDKQKLQRFKKADALLREYFGTHP